MTQTGIGIASKPIWVDLASKDAAGSRAFYEKLFGWRVEVNPDPQYGGYGRATLDGRDAAGIGPTQSPDQPTAWSFYVAAENAAGIAQRIEAAGGKVVAPAFDVGDQGRMATFQDPAGAFFSVWQPTRMGGFQTTGSNAFSWAELNARGVEKAVPFYQGVFGWTSKRSPIPDAADYIEFQVDGESVAGATEMSPTMPAGTPSHWLVYFGVDDIDAAYRKALDLGAHEALAPQDFPGGRFAIILDPQGATLGLLRTDRA
jgi:hypothetical protein